MKALFICGRARHRSPTAAEIVSGWPGVEADCAGLSKDADEPLSDEQLDWANVIFVMEKHQKKRLTQNFPAAKGARIICLNVPDRFRYMDPALIERLEPLLHPHLRQG
ncbi:MAG: phosphotyrosine protein phosphatase [Pseudomonadota bacterium]